MKRRMRNRTYGVVGGSGLYPTTYPINTTVRNTTSAMKNRGI